MQEYYSDDTVDSVDEFDHYEKVLKLLHDGAYKVYRGRGYQCAFCGNVLDKSYQSLLQQADGRSIANARKPHDRSQHKALVGYLRNLPWAPKHAEKGNGSGRYKHKK